MSGVLFDKRGRGGSRQSGLLGALRPLDMFPRIDVETVKSTWHGLLFSFFGLALTVFVLYGEFEAYRTVTRKSDFYLFSPKRDTGSKIPQLDSDLTINFNITFLRLPCEFISVDYYDVFGNKKYDLAEHIKLKSAGKKSFAGSAVLSPSSTVGDTAQEGAPKLEVPKPDTKRGGKRKLLSFLDDAVAMRHQHFHSAGRRRLMAAEAAGGDVESEEAQAKRIADERAQRELTEAEDLAEQHQKVADTAEAELANQSEHDRAHEEALKKLDEQIAATDPRADAKRKKLQKIREKQVEMKQKLDESRAKKATEMAALAKESKMDADHAAQKVKAGSVDKKLQAPSVGKIKVEAGASAEQHMKAAQQRAIARMAREHKTQQAQMEADLKKAAETGDVSVHEKHTGTKQPVPEPKVEPEPEPEPEPDAVEDGAGVLLPMLKLEDLHPSVMDLAKPSEVHPSAIVIRIGEQDRHFVPDAGEHQVIDADHPVHQPDFAGSRLLTYHDFDQYLKTHDNVLVNFFAPWCHWCQRLEPVWEAAAAEVRTRKEYKAFFLTKVDCNNPLNEGLCQRHHVRAYPTILTFRGHELSTTKQYHGDRTVSAFLNYIDQMPKTADEDPEIKTEAKRLRMIANQKTDYCVAWRQTANCNPKDEREPVNDKGCNDYIMTGSSGFCECADHIRTKEVFCVHESHQCAVACREHIQELHKQKEHHTAVVIAHAEEAVRKKDRLLKEAAEQVQRVVESKLHQAKFGKSHEDAERAMQPENVILEQGCQVSGHFDASMVPASMLFTAYSPWHDFVKEAVDMSHVVGHLTYGDYSKFMRNALGEDNAFWSGDFALNTLQNKRFDSTGSHQAHEHYMKLMQTMIQGRVLETMLSRSDLYKLFFAWNVPNPNQYFQTFQYSADSHNYDLEKDSDVLPSVRFIIDIDPLGTNVWAEDRKPLYALVTSVLAIIGGIFTVLSLVDGAFYQTSRLCSRPEKRSGQLPIGN